MASSLFSPKDLFFFTCFLSVYCLPCLLFTVFVLFSASCVLSTSTLTHTAYAQFCTEQLNNFMNFEFSNFSNFLNFEFSELSKFFEFSSFRFFFYRLHQRHPWYAEQVSFVLVNTDNNKYLTKEELMEASKVSEDISILNFSPRQLENLVDGLMGIGDKNGDRKITFDEYVHMSHDVFVNNFAPKNLKRVMRL